MEQPSPLAVDARRSIDALLRATGWSVSTEGGSGMRGLARSSSPVLMIGGQTRAGGECASQSQMRWAVCLVDRSRGSVVIIQRDYLRGSRRAGGMIATHKYIRTCLRPFVSSLFWISAKIAALKRHGRRTVVGLNWSPKDMEGKYKFAGQGRCPTFPESTTL